MIVKTAIRKWVWEVTCENNFLRLTLLVLLVTSSEQTADCVWWIDVWSVNNFVCSDTKKYLKALNIINKCIMFYSTNYCLVWGGFALKTEIGQNFLQFEYLLVICFSIYKTSG